MAKYTMSDGRAFTDYSPSCDLNALIKKQFEIADGNEYRLFLQDNAEKVRRFLMEKKNVGSCEICPVCKQAIEKNR